MGDSTKSDLRPNKRLVDDYVQSLIEDEVAQPQLSEVLMIECFLDWYFSRKNSPQEAGMSLTGEQIEACRPSDHHMKYGFPAGMIAPTRLNALCDMALRSIAPATSMKIAEDWLHDQQMCDPQTDGEFEEFMLGWIRAIQADALASRPSEGTSEDEQIKFISHLYHQGSWTPESRSILWGILNILKKCSRPNAGIPEGWKDISTAPKEGEILAAWDNLTPIQIVNFWNEDWDEEFFGPKPKYWMPLPQPPATTRKPYIPIANENKDIPIEEV